MATKTKAKPARPKIAARPPPPPTTIDAVRAEKFVSAAASSAMGTSEQAKQKPRRAMIYLPPELFRLAKMAALDEGSSFSDFVAEALSAKLKSHV